MPQVTSRIFKKSRETVTLDAASATIKGHEAILSMDLLERLALTKPLLRMRFKPHYVDRLLHDATTSDTQREDCVPKTYLPNQVRR